MQSSHPSQGFTVICAPDSFKGSLSATEVANAMKQGVLSATEHAKVYMFPLSDGGEGLVEALVTSTNGRKKSAQVSDPIGRQVKAEYGLLGDGKTGVLEMAAASGLPLLKNEERNPMETSTYGTGELISALLSEGCKKIIIGIGGSATNDGGLGMFKALGGKLYNADGEDLIGKGKETTELAEIDFSQVDPRIHKTEFIAACDVDNPLTGQHGAAQIFAPQKGADQNAVKTLDKGLQQLAKVIHSHLGMDLSTTPGVGAAGGLGAGIMAFLGGKLSPGIDLVLNTVELESYLSGVQLVITGEGKLDRQTAYGKVPVGVAKRVKPYEIPVVALAGHVNSGAEVTHEAGITAYFSIAPGKATEAMLMKEAYGLVKKTAEQVTRLAVSIGYL